MLHHFTAIHQAAAPKASLARLYRDEHGTMAMLQPVGEPNLKWSQPGA